jgi:hypothetical protein
MVQAKPHFPPTDESRQNPFDLESDRIIQFNHPEKYCTSGWYTGHGEIIASEDRRSFEISASYTLKAKVKLLDGVFHPANQTLFDIYSRRGL